VPCSLESGHSFRAKRRELRRRPARGLPLRLVRLGRGPRRVVGPRCYQATQKSTRWPTSTNPSTFGDKGSVRLKTWRPARGLPIRLVRLGRGPRRVLGPRSATPLAVAPISLPTSGLAPVSTSRVVPDVNPEPQPLFCRLQDLPRLYLSPSRQTPRAAS